MRQACFDFTCLGASTGLVPTQSELEEREVVLLEMRVLRQVHLQLLFIVGTTTIVATFHDCLPSGVLCAFGVVLTLCCCEPPTTQNIFFYINKKRKEKEKNSNREKEKKKRKNT